MSGKVRVYEVAKQLNLDPKDAVVHLHSMGFADVRNHMSTVEPSAVERLRLHLEKQRTHDVVEEKIRPTVVKRRAVAKPAGAEPTPSSARLPPAAPPSVRTLEEPPRSSRRLHDEPNGRAGVLHADAPTRPAIRESQSSLPTPDPEPPVERTVAREPKSSPVVRDRASARSLSVVLDRKSQASLPTVSAPSDSDAAPPPDPGPSPVVPEPVAQPRPEELAAHAAPHEPAHAEPAPEPVRSAPVLADPIEHDVLPRHDALPEQVHANEEPTHQVVADPAPFVAAAVDVPVPLEEPVAPVREPESAPQPTPVSRPSTAPKTGIEYWTGRPGVPITPPAASRTTGPTGAGGLPRRVQYDPRTGTTTGGAGGSMRPGQRPGPGPGGPHGRPPQGRGFPNQFGTRRGPPGAPASRRPPAAVSTQEMAAHKKVIRIEENITLQSMAQKMSLKSTELLMKLLSMGMTGVHINTTLDADTAKILASEFGWEVEDLARTEDQEIAEARGEKEEQAAGKVVVDADGILRPPVVTVMGHVDHGKTSLLDRIRKANVAAGEAGGITQHIGAYKVATPNGTIVFLDTPGHEAFTQMRARGASVTDIVVLVVAADDGVMPQTKEAVAHALAAKVPIVVAINKIDKMSADPDRVKRELVDLGLQPEEWGGDTMFVPVSAHTGEGVQQLLESLALLAEVREFLANPKKPAHGTVLEAKLDKGRGPVATVLVQDGTLRVGDFVLAGAGFGKIRAMSNEHGKHVHEAGPSTPVEILGLSEVPSAGDTVDAVKDAKKAQEIAESRRGKMAKSLIPATAKVSLEELSRRIQESDQQELRVIIKGDVQGSVEAVCDAFSKLSSERVKLSIIHAGVGAITEGDVNLAIASKAIIIGFNQRPAGKAGSLAEENRIEIRTYSIIYNAVDEVKLAMEGLLPPTMVEKVHGRAEVRMIFKVKGLAVAGCFVISGKIQRSGKVRLLRDNAVVFDGRVGALKRFKDDVREVLEGFECGISIDNFNDLKDRDIIESYEVEEIRQRL